jgi:polysaccharide biosynthesis/export protein
MKNKLLKPIFISFMTIFLAILAFGCGIKPQPPIETEQVSEVILGSGDVLNIKFSYSPEMDVTQTIRPDGKISLPLVGDINVSGKTPSVLKEELMTLYTGQIKAPDITIIVQSLYSRRIFVSGEVLRPGMIDYPSRISAFEAIMMVGGFNIDTANLENILIIRYENGVSHGYKLNLRKTLEGRESSPFFLEPNDVIYVPKNNITIANRWVTRYINGIIPQVILSTIPFIVYREFFQK